MDVFGCNLFGIVLGFYVIDKFKLERYRWSFRDAPLHTGAWEQFKYFLTHWDLSKLEMKSFKSLKKYLQLSWYCIFVIYFLFSSKWMTYQYSSWNSYIRFPLQITWWLQESLLLVYFVLMLLKSSIDIWSGIKITLKLTASWCIWWS